MIEDCFRIFGDWSLLLTAADRTIKFKTNSKQRVWIGALPTNVIYWHQSKISNDIHNWIVCDILFDRQTLHTKCNAFTPFSIFPKVIFYTTKITWNCNWIGIVLSWGWGWSETIGHERRTNKYINNWAD